MLIRLRLSDSVTLTLGTGAWICVTLIFDLRTLFFVRLFLLWTFITSNMHVWDTNRTNSDTAHVINDYNILNERRWKIVFLILIDKFLNYSLSGFTRFYRNNRLWHNRFNLVCLRNKFTNDPIQIKDKWIMAIFN
jgi:hypothetical protein